MNQRTNRMKKLWKIKREKDRTATRKITQCVWIYFIIFPLIYRHSLVLCAPNAIICSPSSCCFFLLFKSDACWTFVPFCDTAYWTCVLWAVAETEKYLLTSLASLFTLYVNRVSPKTEPSEQQKRNSKLFYFDVEWDEVIKNYFELKTVRKKEK